MRNIPGKTLVLICVLITLTVVLVGIAVWVSGKKQYTALTTTQTPTPTITKTATIAFSPASLDMTGVASSTASVDLIAASNGTPISGAQVELQYDPKVITNVKVLPPDAANSLFGAPANYFQLFADTKTPGDITYAIAIQPAGQPANGTGSIGKVTFSVVKDGATPNAAISFGKGTIITTKGTKGSVLNSAIPLAVRLK